MRIPALVRQTLMLAWETRFLPLLMVLGGGIVLLLTGATALGLDEPVAESMALGLWLAMVIGDIMGAATPVQFIAQERRDRSIHLTLSLPISRLEYLIGRWLASWVIVTLAYLSMIAVLLAVHGVLFISNEESSFIWPGPAILLTVLNLGVVTALATAFAAYTTPVLASLYTIAVVMACHFADDFERLLTARRLSANTKALIAQIVPLYPDFTIFDVRLNVARGVPVHLEHYGIAAGYFLAMALLFLALAYWAFGEQDLK